MYIQEEKCNIQRQIGYVNHLLYNYDHVELQWLHDTGVLLENSNLRSQYSILIQWYWKLDYLQYFFVIMILVNSILNDR